MNLGQKFFVNGLISFFMFWPLYDLTTGGEHFPFGAFAMYSHAYSLGKLWDSEQLLYAVDLNGKEQLLVGAVGGVPQSTLRSQYHHLLKNLGPQKVGETMQQLLDKCHRDKSCDHNSLLNFAPIAGLRYYRVAYDSVEELRNKNPSRKELLAKAEVPHD